MAGKLSQIQIGTNKYDIGVKPENILGDIAATSFKVTSQIGSASQPVYINSSGKPVAGNSIPTNYVTTDTAQTITGIKTFPASTIFQSPSNGNVELELSRPTSSSWKLCIEGGHFRIRNNYTNTPGDYFDTFTVQYNTGEVKVDKGNLTVVKGDVYANEFIGSLDLKRLTNAKDLQAIEALNGTGLLKRTGDGTWTLDTTAYTTDVTPTINKSSGTMTEYFLFGSLAAGKITNYFTANRDSEYLPRFRADGLLLTAEMEITNSLNVQNKLTVGGEPVATYNRNDQTVFSTSNDLALGHPASMKTIKYVDVSEDFTLKINKDGWPDGAEFVIFLRNSETVSNIAINWPSDSTCLNSSNSYIDTSFPSVIPGNSVLEINVIYLANMIGGSSGKRYIIRGALI